MKKVIVNKEITGIADISYFGGYHTFDIDGEALTEIIGKRTGLHKNQTARFPARVTIIVEDLRENKPALNGTDVLF